ncbi:MAG: DUF4469 domain-containing protein [Odoribacteraceae bacterium]|jgi:hypothetical protein|nr:DUF4469 domain-containing protein [Odoribacteraceae bacterium]
MLRYVLEYNLLTKQDPNDLRARVVDLNSYTEDDLARAVADANIGISLPEARAMLEAVVGIILKWLAGGNAVSLRLMNIHPSIPGKYAEGEYPREAAIRITASKEVAELAKTIPLRHVEPVSPLRIESVHDVKSDTLNLNVTSGGSVKIKGHNIRVTGIDLSVGLEFVNADYPTSTYPVPPGDIIVNNPSELIIIAPLMSPGEEVLLKITTQYAGAKDRKEPLSFTFTKRLTVI